MDRFTQTFVNVDIVPLPICINIWLMKLAAHTECGYPKLPRK